MSSSVRPRIIFTDLEMTTSESLMIRSFSRFMGGQATNSSEESCAFVVVKDDEDDENEPSMNAPIRLEL